MGSSSGSLTSPKHQQAQMRRLPVCSGQRVDGRGKSENSTVMIARAGDFAGHDAACPPFSLASGCMASLFVPLSAVLVQCGKAPTAGDAGRQCAGRQRRQFRRPLPRAAVQGSLPDRERKHQWPSARRKSPVPTEKVTARTDPRLLRGRLESRLCADGLPAAKPREDLTTLVSMKSSAFPYFGDNPRSEASFLNVAKGDRRGHRSYSGQVYWQDETYNDSRVLMHVPETFDANKPGVIVVFFHGNGATLERDVRDRQMVPQQISDSGVNAVLLAPQLAVDAARFQRRQILAAGRLQALHGRVGEPSRPPLWRSEFGQGLCQHADRHRRLQRRLRADRLEPRGRRRHQARPRRGPARRRLWRTRQVRVLDREQPHRLLRQLLHPLHQAATRN